MPSESTNIDKIFFRFLEEFKKRLTENILYDSKTYDEKNILADFDPDSKDPVDNVIEQTRRSLLKLKEGLDSISREIYDNWMLVTLYEAHLEALKKSKKNRGIRIELCEKIAECYQIISNRYEVYTRKPTVKSVKALKKKRYYQKILLTLKKKAADHLKLADTYKELAKSYDYLSDIHDETTMVDYFSKSAKNLKMAARSEVNPNKRAKYLLSAAHAYDALAIIYRNSNYLNRNKEEAFLEKSATLIAERNDIWLIDTARTYNDMSMDPKIDPKKREEYFSMSVATIDTVMRSKLKRRITLKKGRKRKASNNKSANVKNNGISKIKAAFKTHFNLLNLFLFGCGGPLTSRRLDVNKFIEAIVGFYRKANSDCCNTEHTNSIECYQQALARDLLTLNKKELLTLYKMINGPQCQIVYNVSGWIIGNPEHELIKSKDNKIASNCTMLHLIFQTTHEEVTRAIRKNSGPREKIDEDQFDTGISEFDTQSNEVFADILAKANEICDGKLILLETPEKLVHEGGYRHKLMSVRQKPDIKDPSTINMGRGFYLYRNTNDQICAFVIHDKSSIKYLNLSERAKLKNDNNLEKALSEVELELPTDGMVSVTLSKPIVELIMEHTKDLDEQDNVKQERSDDENFEQPAASLRPQSQKLKLTA